MRPDLILRGGHIIDGSGAPGFGGDVAVAGGRIQEIGVVPQVEGAEEIYTRGLTVAPGFIDIHSHSDLTLLVDPRALSAVAQGVTTEVVGNCGHGCAPITDPAIAKAAIYGPVHAAAFDWRSIAGYLEKLEAARPAVNVVTLVPNGQLRLAVVGADRRAATPDELGRMEQLLAEALEQGAAGFSTGLEYAKVAPPRWKSPPCARSSRGSTGCTPRTHAIAMRTLSRPLRRRYARYGRPACASRSRTSCHARAPR
jgi:N-acyl-D-aspartate/D-glutamate deacylase